MTTTASVHDARVSLRLSVEPQLLRRIDRLAAREGVRRSRLLQDLLQRAVDDAEEDQLLAQAGEAAYHDPANQERIPWERVKAELGL